MQYMLILQCVCDKLRLVLVFCFALFIAGCTLSQQEFDTAALNTDQQPTQAPDKQDQPQALAENFSQSALKARELGLPFPKITPRALNEIASVDTIKSEPVVVPPPAVLGDIPSNVEGNKPAVLAAASVAALSRVDAEEARSQKTRKNQNHDLPEITSSLVEVAPSVEIKTQAAAFPTIDDILNKAKRGYDLKSYDNYIKTKSSVDTSCFPRKLRTILRRVHKKFGKKPAINSGYRTASYNRRIGGVRGSYHTKCLAADIKVAGVNKYRLAKFLRSMPDVGGVGVYGCKGVVHVDVGPRRDWHRSCRKRRRA